MASETFEPDVLIFIAQNAERHGGWHEAERCWRQLLSETAQAWWSQVALVRVLLKQGKRAEALAIADTALAGPLSTAPDWVAELLAVLADHLDLSGYGLVRRMEAILASACAEPNPPPKALAGLTKAALCWGDHDAFLARARELFHAHPDRADARRLLHDAIEVTGRGDVLPDAPADLVSALPRSDPNATATAAALSRIESLGGGGSRGGCELGFVQREYGLEPLGLLRWASIQPNRLADMLDRRFDELASPGTLELRMRGHRDWQALDRVYGIRMDHTHLDCSTFSETRARQLVETRMRFLARKLQDDLADGHKLFAYTVTGTSLEEAFVSRIAATLVSYGPGHVLLIGESARGSAFSIYRPFANVTVVHRPALEIGAPLSAIMASWRDVLRIAGLT